MDFFESKLEKDVLKRFRSIQNSIWSGEEKYSALFHVWQNLQKDDLSYCTLNHEVRIINIPGIVNTYLLIGFNKTFPG